MTEPVKHEIDSRGVATITLNRPALHNAFDDRVIESLSALFNKFQDTPEVRVVIITGAGKSFSAGADINWMKKVAELDKEENRRDAIRLAEMFASLNALPKPTIARVNGAAFGGGVGLVACCDFAVASNNAKFALSEVKLGLVPAVISTYVIDAIGFRQARRFFLSGETFSAAMAKHVGLVHETIEEEKLDAAVTDQVEQLLRAGPLATQRCKQLVFDMAGINRENARELMEKNAALIAELRVSDEGRQGLLAFLEKRSPAWRS